MKRMLVMLATICMLIFCSAVIVGAADSHSTENIEPVKIYPGESYGSDNPNIHRIPTAPRAIAKS